METNGDWDKRNPSVIEVMDWVSEPKALSAAAAPTTTTGTSPNGSPSSRGHLNGRTGFVDPSYRPKKLNCWPQRLDSEGLHENHSTVMVLYCGGTIGMRTKNGGKI